MTLQEKKTVVQRIFFTVPDLGMGLNGSQHNSPESDIFFFLGGGGGGGASCCLV